nr:hypothetical protein [Mesorhizobium sp.]
MAQDIRIESCQSIDPHTVGQHAVSRKSFVDHRDLAIGLLQSIGDMVWPAIIGVGGRTIPVRDGIPEKHDRLGFRRGINPYIAQKKA